MPELDFHPLIGEDLQNIAAWYLDRQAFDAAERFPDAFQRKVEFILKQPRLAAEVRDGIRKSQISGFPYHIFYEYDGERVFIGGVLHEKRHPDTYKNRFS